MNGVFHAFNGRTMAPPRPPAPLAPAPRSRFAATGPLDHRAQTPDETQSGAARRSPAGYGRSRIALATMVLALSVPGCGDDDQAPNDDAQVHEDVALDVRGSDSDGAQVDTEPPMRIPVDIQVTIDPDLFPQPWGPGSLTVYLGLPSGIGPVYATRTVELSRIGDNLPMTIELEVPVSVPDPLALHVTLEMTPGNPKPVFRGTRTVSGGDLRSGGPRLTIEIQDLDENTPIDAIQDFCGGEPLDREERACVVDFLWRAGLRNQAFLAAKSIDWEDAHTIARAAADREGPDTDFYRSMATFVSHLKDHHWGFVGLPLAEQFIACPDLPVVLHEGRIFLGASASLPPELAAGDEVTAVDGMSSAERLDLAGGLFSRHHALRFERTAQSLILCGPAGSDAALEIQTESGLIEVTEPRVLLLDISLLTTGSADEASPVVRGRSLVHEDLSVGYLRIDSFAPARLVADFDAVLEGFREMDALLIDVRGNPGGSISGMTHVAGRFMTEPVTAYARVGADGTRAPVTVEPSGSSQYEGPVAVLVDELSYSASTLFAAVMRARGAIIVGRPTGGGTSPVGFQRYRLTAQSRLSTSTDFFYDVDGDGPRVDMQGLAPDFSVPYDRADLVHGRVDATGDDDDPVLREALARLP